MADVRLAITLDSAGAIKNVQAFNNELDKTPASAAKAGTGVDFLKKQLDSFVSGMSMGAGFAAFKTGLDGIIGGIRAVGEAFSKSMGMVLAYSDKMITLSQRTGLATDSMQVLNVIAKTSGTEIDMIGKAVGIMSKAIVNGDQSFKKLGLSVEQLKNMSPDAAFAKVGAAIGNISDPMQRTTAALEIFGKTGSQLMPVFTERMARATEQAQAFGLVLDKDLLSASESAGDALDVMGMAADAFTMRLGGIVAEAPAFKSVIESISKVFGDMSKALDENRALLVAYVDQGIRKMVDGITKGIEALRNFLGAWDLLKGLIPATLMPDFAKTMISAAIPAMDILLAKTQGVAEAMKSALVSSVKLGDMNGGGVLKAGGRGMFGDMNGGGVRFGGGTAAVGAFDGADYAKRNAAAEKRMKAEEDWFTGAKKYAAELAASTLSLNKMIQGALSKGLEHTASNITAAQGYLAIRNARVGFPGLTPKIATKIDPGGWYNHAGTNGYADLNLPKASMSAAQALQNFANLAALSTSKLGKAMASAFGGASGVSSGVSAFKGATDFMGKLGAVGSIATAGIGIISGIMGLFKKKPKEPAPAPPAQASAAAWASFTGDQQSKGAAGVLAGVSGIRVTSPADMAAQASIASQSFWAMFKEQGLIKAADAFKAVRDKMIETFKAAGASDEAIGAMLGGVSTMVDLAGNEAFRGAADGANGFAQALAAIANQQLPMTIDQFRAFEQQAVAGYEQMKAAALAQGLSAEESIKVALQGSAQYIQTLRDAAAKYGLDLGAGTQNLMDLAGQNGIAMASDVQERLILSLNALTEALGGAPPAFQQAISNGARGGAGGAGGGDSLAEAMDRGFVGLGRTIVEGISRIPAPQIYMDTGALVGEIAGAVDRGVGSALSTSLEGR